jgi:hypothetical protein
MSGYRVFYRVAKSFRLGTRTFAKGEILRAEDPVVERINNANPGLLFVTVRSTRPSSPRPQEVAGLRSPHRHVLRTEGVDERPRRDWLAQDPSWRLP